MELQTFTYTADQGWSLPEFPKLDSNQTLVMVFGASEYLQNSKPIMELIKAFPQAKITGCSSAGEIFDSTITDSSLSVAVMRFQDTLLESALVKIDNADQSFDVGKQIASQLNHEGLRGIFLLSDGLKVNGTQLISGINSVVSPDIVVTGGLAGDGDRFKKTWVINNNTLDDSCVSAVGFYGNKIHIGHGSQGGWDSFGLERRVTKSKNNILYELDGKPALELYKEYLGERAKGLPATGLLFPLAIRKDANDPKEIVRTILAVDEKDQSMKFAGDIPTGYLAKLMRANFDRIVTGANDAAITAGNAVKTKGPILAVAISCVGRRLLLGERTEEETEATLESLPSGTKQIGFYSYGEISPYSTGTCDLHNQTMTLTVFTEDQ